MRGLKRVFLLTICAAQLLCACEKTQSTPTPRVATHKPGELTLSQEQAKQIGLTTMEVRTRQLPVEILVAGSVKADPTCTTPVNSLVPGRLEEVLVQQGDKIHTGQVLARIRSDEVAQQENEFLTKVLELQADRKQAELRKNLAQKVADRKRTLYQEKIAAMADVEQAEAELDEATAAVSALDDKREALIVSTKERLRLFGLGDEAIQRILKRRETQVVFDIRAPRGGIIAVRDGDPGEMIDGSKPLFVVADHTRVWLVAEVYEKDIKFIHSHTPVKVKVESFPGEEFRGILEFIDSQVDPQTRTLSVRATIDNPNFRLKPEMFARLSIEVGQAQVLVVPTKSVQRIGETSVVYVARGGGRFDERKVKTGRLLGDYLEVVDGLKSGELVVADGSLQLLGRELDEE